MDPLTEKWENGVCTYPLCPIKNMVTLNCKGCKANQVLSSIDSQQLRIKEGV